RASENARRRAPGQPRSAWGNCRRMNGLRSTSSICLALVLTACPSEATPGEETGSDDDSTGASATLTQGSSPTSTSMTTAGTDPTTDPGTSTAADTADTADGDSTSMGFVGDPDVGGGGGECDVFAQDCPKGEKCMPWANDGGGSWNATTCSPVED